MECFELVDAARVFLDLRGVSVVPGCLYVVRVSFFLQDFSILSSAKSLTLAQPFGFADIPDIAPPS